MFCCLKIRYIKYFRSLKFSLKKNYNYIKGVLMYMTFHTVSPSLFTKCHLYTEQLLCVGTIPGYIEKSFFTLIYAQKVEEIKKKTESELTL